MSNLYECVRGQIHHRTTVCATKDPPPHKVTQGFVPNTHVPGQGQGSFLCGLSAPDQCKRRAHVLGHTRFGYPGHRAKAHFISLYQLISVLNPLTVRPQLRVFFLLKTQSKHPRGLCLSL